MPSVYLNEGLLELFQGGKHALPLQRLQVRTLLRAHFKEHKKTCKESKKLRQESKRQYGGFVHHYWRQWNEGRGQVLSMLAGKALEGRSGEEEFAWCLINLRPDSTPKLQVMMCKAAPLEFLSRPQEQGGDPDALADIRRHKQAFVVPEGRKMLRYCIVHIMDTARGELLMRNMFPVTFPSHLDSSNPSLSTEQLIELLNQQDRSPQEWLVAVMTLTLQSSRV